MELVFFSIMGDCICKIVCQFFGMGSVYFWVCFLVGVYLYWAFLVVGGYVWCWVGLFVGW